VNSATGDIGWQSAKERRVALCSLHDLGWCGRGAATEEKNSYQGEGLLPGRG
jgi:hypothetical protein